MLCSYPVLSGCHCLQNQVGTVFPPWPAVFPTLPFNHKPMRVVCTLPQNSNSSRSSSSSSEHGSLDDFFAFLLFFFFLNILSLCTTVNTVCLKCMLKLLQHQLAFNLYYCVWLHITFSLSCSGLSLQQS